MRTVSRVRRTSKRVVTTTQVTITFDEEHLRGVLGLPKEARLFVEAPTGGDCSGMDLGVDECGGLTASWSTHDEKVEETEDPLQS